MHQEKGSFEVGTLFVGTFVLHVPYVVLAALVAG